MKREDYKILKHMRNDSRTKLADIARELNIPITTVHDRFKKLNSTVITKHATMIDFRKLGNPHRVNIAISAVKKNALKEFLLEHKNVNTVAKIKDYDFFVDAIFPNMARLYDFVEELETFRIRKQSMHHIIDELKTEDFLTKDEHLDMI